MSGFPEAVRQLILERDGFRCVRCRASQSLHLHHRRPKGMGGTSLDWVNRAANGITLCLRCHERTHSHPADSYETGFLVHRSEADAESVPLIYPNDIAVFLLDDGTTIHTRASRS